MRRNDEVCSPCVASCLPKTHMMAFHQPHSRNVRSVDDREPQGGSVDLPAITCQCGLQPASLFSVCELMDDLLKICLRKLQALLKEALANLQGMVDHHRGRPIGLHADRGLLPFEFLQASRQREGQQHVLQTIHTPLSHPLPSR